MLLTSGVVDGVGVDKLDSLCIEVVLVTVALLAFISLLVRNANNSVTGCGAGASSVLAVAWEIMAVCIIGILANVFRFLQHKIPHL